MDSTNTAILRRLQFLEQSLEKALVERNRAQQEARRWRKLYETEAQQRRTELQQMQTHLQTLQQERDHLSEAIHNLRGEPADLSCRSDSLAADRQDSDIEASKSEIVTLIKEKTELQLALAQEREAHQKTRHTLINAIGDALHKYT